MKKASLLIPVLLCIFLCSCKKKNELAQPANSANSSSNLYDGILTAGISQTIINGNYTPYPDISGNAWFGPVPSSAYNPGSFVHVDSVLLNHVQLKFRSYYYVDSNYMISNLPPIIWHVVGGNGIPSFDFTNTTALPSYTGYTSFPDSIDHNQNINISLSGISNASKAVCFIVDELGNYIYKEFNVTDNVVSFPASSMASLTPCAYGYMYINLRNENPQSIGGKNFRFDNYFQVVKYIKIK